MTTPNMVAPSSDMTELKQNDWNKLNKKFDQYTFDGWWKGRKYHFVVATDRIGSVDEGMWVETYEVYKDDGADSERFIRMEFDKGVAQYVQDKVNDIFWRSFERR